MDCPKGAALGHYCTPLFTDDLPLVLQNSKISMYADDLTIYASACSVNELNIILNFELHLVVEWIKRNKLVVNVAKTNCILFGSHYILSRNPVLRLSINDMSIEQVKKTKLLGIILDDKLSWTNHINKIVSKMGSGISVIKRCAKCLSPNSTRQVVQALILSNLDYCSVVWVNSTMEKIAKKLQIFQNRATLLVLHCNYRSYACMLLPILARSPL